MPELDLIDNALDFLSLAGDNLQEFEATGNARDVKYALLHLASGVALLLKERLARDHWALVFADINKASKAAYESGDFISPGMEDCVGRVCSICGLEILPTHRQSLSSLRRLRNKIEHFRFEVSREEGLSIAARTWSFIFDFVQDHLAADFEEPLAVEWEALKAKMLQIEEFIRQRREETAPQIDEKKRDGSTIVDCPLCLEGAFCLDEDNRGCVFCRYNGTVEEVFNAWMTCFYGSDWTDPKERMTNDPVDNCPQCGGLYFIKMPGEGSAQPPSPAFVCFKCGYTEETTVECSSCETEFTPADWDDYPFICDDCKREAAGDQG